MLPTLKIGDFIFVNKFSYGIKPPIFWNHKIIKTGEPKRGDIIVFRYPVNPNINFIKELLVSQEIKYHILIKGCM